MPLGTDTIKARKETFALCEVIHEQNSQADIQNLLLMSADCFAIYASPPNPYLMLYAFEDGDCSFCVEIES